MNPQTRIEKSDTFGRNTKADLELLRRINDQSENKGEEVFALFIACLAVLFILIMGAVVAHSIHEILYKP